MLFRRLQTRFLVAGALLVAATVACGAWSVVTFARLGSVVDDTLRDRQETIDLVAVLANALEREDDALLLALTGNVASARAERAAQRSRFDAAFAALLPHLKDGEPEAAARLRRHADDYRRIGDAFLNEIDGKTVAVPPAIERYQREVNPALRLAVADCEKLRELNFAALSRAGVGARDEARRATAVIVVTFVTALLLSTFVSVRLARSVLRPIQEMRTSLDALRQGDFARRVPAAGAEEFAQLGDGFNRMAEDLAEYRRSSLGDVLAAKQTLEATLNALPDAVIVLDPAGTVVAVNPPARAVLAALHSGTATRLDDLPLSPKQRDAARAAMEGRQSIPERTNFREAITVAVDGGPRKLLLAAAPIPEFQPHHSGAVLVLDDVTAFARLDELRSELIAVVSHELKTPLTTLSLNLMMLSEWADNLTPHQRDIVAAAVLGCEELGDTIDELLDLTRIEAGQLRLERTTVQVGTLIAQTVRSLQPRFDDAEVALRFVANDPNAAVPCDMARLRIVLTNLLTNALKYSPRGGSVVVQLSSGQNAQVGGRPAVQIAVTDGGPGVPAAYRERIFEKFFRLEHEQHEPARRAKGAGVGLYLCRQIVEAHGGTIRCESGDDGYGTRIAIHLPTDV
jgi:NtrC-family two-component system sensor histidine kinase KinB